ncbi:MAG TPA: flavin reductase family protein [Acidimicrobiales bacterium]|nr:flavin reductase family protein [Acidimicrobiales bacterium]
MTTEAAFQDLVGDLDYPMTIVTASSGGEKAGCLVGFATQCSIHPPRYAVWISRQNHTLAVAREASVLAVHFPSVDDRRLAELFGHETADEVDKFARCRWREGPAGVPVLEDCARWFAGEVVEHVPTDDHVGFLLAPIHAQSGPWAGQLGFQSAKAISPGHEA